MTCLRICMQDATFNAWMVILVAGALKLNVQRNLAISIKSINESVTISDSQILPTRLSLLKLWMWFLGCGCPSYSSVWLDSFFSNKGFNIKVSLYDGNLECIIHVFWCCGLLTNCLQATCLMANKLSKEFWSVSIASDEMETARHASLKQRETAHKG